MKSSIRIKTEINNENNNPKLDNLITAEVQPHQPHQPHRNFAQEAIDWGVNDLGNKIMSHIGMDKQEFELAHGKIESPDDLVKMFKGSLKDNKEISKQDVMLLKALEEFRANSVLNNFKTEQKTAGLSIVDLMKKDNTESALQTIRPKC